MPGKDGRARARRGGWRSRGFWVTGLVLGLVAVSVTAISVVLLNPPKNEPGPVDVIVVIAGDTDGRHELAAELINAGIADNLVVSNPAGARDAAGSALCRGEGIPDDVEIWCMDPQPPTTTGEAQTFDEIAREEGWRTAVAVTNRPHHYRVRLNFSQCTDVDTTVVSIENVVWFYAWYSLGREMGGYLKHVFTDPC